MAAGTVYWFTGLSGSGKTTVGRLFFERLKSLSAPSVFLDGDALREVWGETQSHTTEDRKRLAYSYGRLCKLLSDQGINVVIATISLFHDCHRWNRDHLSCYREIYIDASIPTLRKRDVKGLYQEPSKNVVGLDLPFERPECPDYIIHADRGLSPERIVEDLVEVFMEDRYATG